VNTLTSHHIPECTTAQPLACAAYVACALESVPSRDWRLGKGSDKSSEHAIFGARANEMSNHLPAGFGGLPGLDRRPVGDRVECGPQSTKRLASDQEKIP
jgi:hypothetical protein